MLRVLCLVLLSTSAMGFFGNLFGFAKRSDYGGSSVMGEESIMAKKEVSCLQKSSGEDQRQLAPCAERTTKARSEATISDTCASRSVRHHGRSAKCCSFIVASLLVIAPLPISNLLGLCSTERQRRRFRRTCAGTATVRQRTASATTIGTTRSSAATSNQRHS